MYSEVSQLFDSGGSGITLFEIGITTGKYSDKGQLKIDETRLRHCSKPGNRKAVYAEVSVIYSPTTPIPKSCKAL